MGKVGNKSARMKTYRDEKAQMKRKRLESFKTIYFCWELSVLNLSIIEFNGDMKKETYVYNDLIKHNS